MSTLSKEKKLHNHERTLYQLDDEDIKEYKMLLDYIQFQNIPDLVRAYHVSTRTIYNIKKKNKWNERIEEYQKKCSKIYIKETFGLINKYHNKKRDNLMNLALSVQNVVENFNECIYMDPLVQQQIFKKDQMEMINIVRQSTRALIDLQKLDTEILEKLKFFGIDLSPEAIQKFEQEEILGDSMLEQEFDTKEIIENIPFRPYCNTNSMEYFKDVKDEYFYNDPKETPEFSLSSAGGGGCEADGGGLSDNIQIQLNKTQNFIENTKKHLEELSQYSDTEFTSSDIEPVEMPDEEEEDEEKYYDEFAPENHRYPFPMEYLIPNEL